jgi:hypothetical protein
MRTPCRTSRPWQGVGWMAGCARKTSQSAPCCTRRCTVVQGPMLRLQTSLGEWSCPSHRRAGANRRAIQYTPVTLALALSTSIAIPSKPAGDNHSLDYLPLNPISHPSPLFPTNTVSTTHFLRPRPNRRIARIRPVLGLPHPLPHLSLLGLRPRLDSPLPWYRLVPFERVGTIGTRLECYGGCICIFLLYRAQYLHHSLTRFTAHDHWCVLSSTSSMPYH